MKLRKTSWIDGQWVDGKSKVDVLNPATGKSLAKVAQLDAEQIGEAVSAADRAYRSGVWSSKTPQQRAAVLSRAAGILRRRSEEFAQVETANVGKPLKESRFIDVAAAIDTLEYYSSIAGLLSGESPRVGDGMIDFKRREPIGVVGLITPWNFPVMLAVRKLAPALLAGNTAVLKPATVTPLTTLLLAEVLAEAELPAGVANIVTGSGGMVGKVLSEHPAVHKVSLTGSAEVGSKLMAACAGDLKATCMELGGKSPAVVCRDADMEKAVDGVLFGAFLNQGECCCAATRLLLDKPIAKKFLDRFIEAVKGKIVLGDPAEEKTTMGPLISREHLDRVAGYVDRAEREGGKVLYRGEVGGLAAGGFWYPPVVMQADPSMEIYREEVFGPVLAVTVFDGLDALLAAANDTDYGLAASIFTESMPTAERAVRELAAGTVWVNCHNVVFNAAPYGGYKHSGIGRECGVEGLLAYTQIKNAIIYGGSAPFGWY